MQRALDFRGLLLIGGAVALVAAGGCKKEGTKPAENPTDAVFAAYAKRIDG